MKTSIWKWFGAVAIGLVVGCYTAFVAECYWNWFAVGTLRVSQVSFLQMLGILWLLQILASQISNGDDDYQWGVLFSVIELLVPEEKRDALQELTKFDPSTAFFKGFSKAVGQIGSNTLMLGLGFILHFFA